ncbi:PCYCGC motif-containing (lipo)protein [Cytobacillus sp. FJAT-54145]|uniref:PCYCGC motif-containing (Lipo)protein n=1 Tax=Cytobacillus spartinae TaxID=3299023 RepID=A0ABW6KGX0_9BACI
MTRKLLSYFLFLGTLMFLITGCSNEEEVKEVVPTVEPAQDHGNHTYNEKNGDLRELTTSVDTLPIFLKDKPEQMQIIYSAAAQHQELLEYIPCYCGCAESGNHQDAYDCFVYANKENGEVVWDDHGTRCGVCLETAAESILQYKDGKSMMEIREYIDEKYKEGFSEPTPTKMPEGV